MAAEHQQALSAQLAELLTSTPLQQERTVTARAAVLVIDHLVLAGRLLGGGRPVDERAASRALAGTALDRDDVHWDQLVHPGAIVWSTVLELGIERGSTGREVMRAASIGYETMVRLSALFPPHALMPFHLTAITGPAAAAAAASALLMPGGRVSPHALGHALSVAGGSSTALRERSDTRRFHRAHAVRTGLAAARAAADGVTATARDLETGGGVLSAIDQTRLDGLLTGDQRALLDSSVRLFPTSGWFQCAYEAALLAARDVRGSISMIAVSVPMSVAERSIPWTVDAGDTWDSLESSVAHAVASARPGLSVAELTRRVVVDGSSRSGGAFVRITHSTATSAAEVNTPLGHPYRPATMARLARTWGVSVRSASWRVGRVQTVLESARPIGVQRHGDRIRLD